MYYYIKLKNREHFEETQNSLYKKFKVFWRTSDTSKKTYLSGWTKYLRIETDSPFVPENSIFLSFKQFKTLPPSHTNSFEEFIAEYTAALLTGEEL